MNNYLNCILMTDVTLIISQFIKYTIIIICSFLRSLLLFIAVLCEQLERPNKYLIISQGKPAGCPIKTENTNIVCFNLGQKKLQSKTQPNQCFYFKIFIHTIFISSQQKFTVSLLFLYFKLFNGLYFITPLKGLIKWHVLKLACQFTLNL